MRPPAVGVGVGLGVGVGVGVRHKSLRQGSEGKGGMEGKGGSGVSFLLFLFKPFHLKTSLIVGGESGYQ